MLERLFERPEWKFFAALPRADVRSPSAGGRPWSSAAFFRLRRRDGHVVAAVQRGGSLGAPLGARRVVFVLLQVLPPLHQALTANLGSRVAAWLYDRLTDASVRPPGMGHLEDPTSPATSRWRATSTSA